MDPGNIPALQSHCCGTWSGSLTDFQSTITSHQLTNGMLLTPYLSMPIHTFHSDKSLFHSCVYGILELISNSLSLYEEENKALRHFS